MGDSLYWKVADSLLQWLHLFVKDEGSSWWMGLGQGAHPSLPTIHLITLLSQQNEMGCMATIPSFQVHLPRSACPNSYGLPFLHGRVSPLIWEIPFTVYEGTYPLKRHEGLFGRSSINWTYYHFEHNMLIILAVPHQKPIPRMGSRYLTYHFHECDCTSHLIYYVSLRRSSIYPTYAQRWNFVQYHIIQVKQRWFTRNAIEQ